MKLIYLKYIVLSVIIFFAASLDLKAQDYLEGEISDITPPYRTQLLEKETKKIQTLKVTEYEYRSDLSQDEIVEYYRDLFSSQGMKKIEDSTEDDLKTLGFIKGSLDRVLLMVWEPWGFGHEYEGKVSYSLEVYERYDILGFSQAKFKKPQQLSFAPTYQQASQFVVVDQPNHMRIVEYLARSEPEAIADFYRQKMPVFGWNFLSEKPYEGKLSLEDALKMGFPDLSDKSAEKKLPGINLNLKGTSLIFKDQSSKNKSVLTIIQFKDAPEVLKQKRIDPAALERYGNTFIYLIAYDEAKVKKELNKLK